MDGCRRFAPRVCLASSEWMAEHSPSARRGTRAALCGGCEGVECVGEPGNAAFVKGCEKCVHRHSFTFRLSVGCVLEPDQVWYIHIYISYRNFSVEVFYLLMGFRKVQDLSKGGWRESSISHCVPALASGDVHHTWCLCRMWWFPKF